MDAGSDETPNIVSSVFLIIAEIVFLGSVLGACLMRRPSHDPKAIPFKSLFIFLLSQSIQTAFKVYGQVGPLANKDEEDNNRAIFIVAQICDYLQGILILIVFYRLIYAYKAQNRTETTKTTLPTTVRGSMVVSLAILSLTHIISQALLHFGYGGDYGRSTYGLQLACDSLFLIAALDIMFQIVTTIRNLNHANRSSMIGAPSLAVGVFFYFTHRLSLVVSDGIRRGPTMPGQVPLSQEIVSAICITGQCIGIVHYCMQQHKVGIHSRRSPSSADDERTHILPAFNEETL
ncbi:hypothetical protein AbraIFM66950_010438 [Aspergillus brasiliensis]|nr:hypothetical protein AbraIFM66950_010438 [Aspergillus brasiliensis]